MISDLNRSLGSRYFLKVVARLNDRNRIATFIEKLAHCLQFFEKKKESSPHKRRSREKDMESLMCDGCEGEYNKQLCES